ncbi:MAG: DHHA1 domain-containing protein, partial [Anaerolineales bacterium]
MHLILSHEHADFDAVASIYAASLLYPEATPVLPLRLNRNVRGFFTLYGENFLFSEQQELKIKSIRQLTVVDSQNPVTLKGFGPNTQVTVIDHHPLEPDLSPSWDLQVEKVGATTTLLVENLKERGIDLSGPPATLMLLGIYEDTGSLSYPGTTPRDVRAAAWLLEQGASLVIAADFLHQPLSTEQQTLFEQLLESAVVSTIQGHEIVIAKAQAGGTTDEISTLAHKLGDVYDVSALFLIVGLNGRVQLVTRSYAESIDVGGIAERLGGGGHARAAAALIKDSTVGEVEKILIARLEEAVEPASTVGEIMSRGPQLLDSADTVAEAAERMQRYGHEGYPVTD